MFVSTFESTRFLLPPFPIHHSLAIQRKIVARQRLAERSINATFILLFRHDNLLVGF